MANKTINDVSNVTTDPVNEDKLLLWNNSREKTTKITFENLLKYEQKKSFSFSHRCNGSFDIFLCFEFSPR